MKTAEEFLQDTVIENNNSFDIVSDLKITSDVTKAMIEFAKMHVQAALQKVVDKIDVEDVINDDNTSILNAYPVSNIK